MKSSPSKSMKTGAGKKRSRDEATGSAQGSTPPTSPPRPNPNKEWKKYKAKTEDLLALVNSGFLREKEMDMWRAVTGDPYPMEKNPDEIPMFARFVERGLALPASDFFKGLLKYYGIEYPLVVDPVIDNARFSKVLMDGGSSLNILYEHTLRLLGIGLDQLRLSTTPFHGVAPSKRV
jgi:hypothetical protein